MTSPTPPARKRYTELIIGLIAAIVAALIGVGALLYILGQRSSATPATEPSVPVVGNIPRPNQACTLAADRKLTAGDDLSSILVFGYVDGRQTEMLAGNSLSLQIDGHKVERIWYCPLRSQWQ